MTGQPAPPPAKSGALRWILIGCGCLLFVGIAAVAGCGLLGYIAIKKAMEEVAEPGKQYLLTREELSREFGAPLTNVQFAVVGSQISDRNGVGVARIHYTFETGSQKGDADVELQRIDGQWTAIGCQANVGSRNIRMGKQVHLPDHDHHD